MDRASVAKHARDRWVGGVAQLGASLSDVSREFLGLWLLVVTYAGIAVIVEFRNRRAAPDPAFG